MAFCAGVQKAARALCRHVLPKMPQAAAGVHTEQQLQPSAGRWSNLKGVLEEALHTGLAMAESAKQDSAAEDQWHGLACTVQLAVCCMGITYCTERVCNTS